MGVIWGIAWRGGARSLSVEESTNFAKLVRTERLPPDASPNHSFSDPTFTLHLKARPLYLRMFDFHGTSTTTPNAGTVPPSTGTDPRTVLCVPARALLSTKLLHYSMCSSWFEFTSKPHVVENVSCGYTLRRVAVVDTVRIRFRLNQSKASDRQQKWGCTPCAMGNVPRDGWLSAPSRWWLVPCRVAILCHAPYQGRFCRSIRGGSVWERKGKGHLQPLFPF